jgi:hypothetical protein
MAILALGARVSTAADECLTLLEVPLEFEQYDAIETLSNKLVSLVCYKTAAYVFIAPSNQR